MNQKPTTDPGTQLSKAPGLKPALAAALNSLEVQLDQELSRYRRTRTGPRTLKAPRLVSISSLPQQLSAMATATDETPSPRLLSSFTDTLEAETAPTTVQTEDVADVNNLPLTSEPEETANPAPTISSIVPATAEVNQSSNLLGDEDSPTQPDDYLESSEALRRSLTDEPSPANKPTSTNDSLLSPLGIGSMLLLLLASLTLGYVAFNPKVLSGLKISNLFNGNSSTPANQPAAVESNSAPPPQPPLTPIPKYPNLAAKEFPEVRDPNDIVGLQPKVQTAPATVPNPVVPIQPANPANVAPAPNPSPLSPTTIAPAPKVLPQSPISVAPAPKTAIAPPAKPTPKATPTQLNSEIKPAADGFYHIVTDNQGDRSLATAQQVIPDAYVSLDSKVIYLGALKTPEQVQRQLQFLQSKGIKARVQSPQP